jgi:hypothetical protein
LDTRPDESVCASGHPSGPTFTLLPEREVPLGGLRGMTVRRTLPQREVPTVGAWCFLDQFGPASESMRVLPHPHVGLQTVTWPFAGTIRHRDSLGNDVTIEPGELNLMTSGHGISHSEFSEVDEDHPLHGLQLWVALPEDARHGIGRFDHHADLPVLIRDGLVATVLLGEFMGLTSPAKVHSPLVGVDMTVAAGDRRFPLDPSFEHALLVVSGRPVIEGEVVAPGPLVYLGTGRHDVSVVSDHNAHLVLLGGAPFDEELVMWWNFIGRNHDEIVQARTEWEQSSARFGTVHGHDGARIPAPPIPPVTLTPRRRYSRD